jgi:hypothetical protein
MSFHRNPHLHPLSLQEESVATCWRIDISTAQRLRKMRKGNQRLRAFNFDGNVRCTAARYLIQHFRIDPGFGRSISSVYPPPAALATKRRLAIMVNLIILMWASPPLIVSDLAKISRKQSSATCTSTTTRSRSLSWAGKHRSAKSNGGTR